MPRDIRLYLQDVLEAIDKIQTYTHGVTFQEFRQTGILVDSVLYNLEIIGEAVKNLPDSIKAHHPGVEWRKIAGLRDIIAHDYFGVSLEIIWEVVQDKLPALRTIVVLLLEGEQ